MGHARFPDGFRRVNKKKLVLAAVIIIGIIILVILLLVGAIISALLGQADSGGIGTSISGLIAALWNAALDFIQALWKQIIANPLQLLTSGGN